MEMYADPNNATGRFNMNVRPQVNPGDITVTVFDALNPPVNISLAAFNKGIVSFGRNPDNDIRLSSNLVSRVHGRFCYTPFGWKIEDTNSTNGITFNHSKISGRLINDGDIIRIDSETESIANGVLFIVSAGASAGWKSCPIVPGATVTIGRSPQNQIVIPHVTVSKMHAIVQAAPNGFFLTDNHSTNGVLVNGRRITGSVQLGEKDVITITNSKLIFTSRGLYYMSYTKGISVDARNIVIERKAGKKTFVTCNNVSLDIHPGELVSIIGGSGAGKSTILNAMCGYLKPASGNVYINGNDLYSNFDSLKKLIGYVPQQDIVYDNLSLYDMLKYASKLRLPDDISDEEREQAITRAIDTVELSEKRDAMIKALSGGQRKRASIAVELLSDPNLIFLDEPASGLDPGTERNLMHSLRQMANSGKTVILVTHSTLQLKLCDKIVFMGKGGNLCFFGSHDDALKFFGVTDVIDVYNMITDHAPEWRDAYLRTVTPSRVMPPEAPQGGGKKENLVKQFGVLSARYIKLIVNDRRRTVLLLCQAPLLAILISLVADGEQFDQWNMTNSLLFALSCCGFWVGMLNSIQEICKERTVIKREYMTGLSLTTYLLSKIIVLGLLCFIQCLMITGIFALLIGLPDEGILLPPLLEIFNITFMTAWSAAAMGLFVSSLFSNADRAMTVAPILLLPQMLFSGILFKLEGATEAVSWLTICKWSMEGYGSVADLNNLPTKQLQEFQKLAGSADYQEAVLGKQMVDYLEENTEFMDAFDPTFGHLFFNLFMMFAFVVLFTLLARIVLRRISKD